MPDMKMIGPHERAKQARAAVNRLRGEVESVIQVGRGMYELPSAVGEIAETLAILRQTLILIQPHVPEESRAEFARLLPWYAEYHEVMR